MGQTINIELNKKLFKNIDETMLTQTFAALENCFVTESSGLSRFPGLSVFVDLPNNAEMFASEFGNDMIAVGRDGRTFRIDNFGNSAEIEGTPVLGGDRVSFAKTRDGLFMCAGAQIVKYNGVKNDIASPDAPLSSFVGYIDGYLLAVEKESGRFAHSELNNFASWPALNLFAVDGNPDNVNALLITPFNELLFSGEQSIEQYERYVGGDVPFFRRWSTGDGISEPNTLCYADNGAWGLNTRYEFVRLSGQTTQSVSDDIQKEIEDKFGLAELQNLNKAWAAPAYVKGQKFIIFQAPEAENTYGTKGFTAVFDIRRGQWFEIFGWNDENGVPELWPGRSVFQMWGRTFVGGEGKIYELNPKAFKNDEKVQRVYVRTAHFDDSGPIRINKVTMTIKRGVGTYEFNPKIMFRANGDFKGFNNPQYRDLGLTGNNEMVIEFGQQGTAENWQFEMSCTDDCPFEIRKLSLDVDRLER